MINRKIPELLAPAGSYSAFVAAISSGADAVYLGGGQHNARIGAKNFTDEELTRAIFEAHLHGKKIYVTLNTLISDRELDGVLSYAESLIEMGADAFIVQDLGLMRALRTAFPEAELHASTQCITHSLDGVLALKEMGASRAVVARELDRDNLSLICRESPIEIEAFVHGALCVCHSGACLFSSLVGGRSGNRGECAQPCRLPYKVTGLDSSYPLSLSDLTLSNHLSELAEMGVSSLKIEGRMKSEDYVGGVVRVFRELIDMGRDADRSDVERLARLFSRGGFTDGYYRESLGKKMFGVRSAEDKESTRQVEKESYELPKIPIDAEMTVSGKGAELRIVCNGKESSAVSAPPDVALNRPIDESFAREQISKLGQTPFYLDKFTFSADGSYILPKSVINALRREALNGLNNKKQVIRNALEPIGETEPHKYQRYVILAPHRRGEVKSLMKTVDRVYAPLYSEEVGNGVAMPVVIKDSERAEVLARLEELKAQGVKYAYAESLSAIRLGLEAGFEVLAGVRANVYNSRTLEVLRDMGVKGAVLSAELSGPAKRDIVKALPVGEVIYGRAPLMIMENCVMNLRDSCRDCSDFKECRKHTVLVDRRGVSFPVYPEYFHRCQIYNSVPTFNADRITRGASFGVIFITDEKSAFETVKQIINGVMPKEYTRKG